MWCRLEISVLVIASCCFLSVAVGGSSVGRVCDTPELYEAHPALCHMLDRLHADPDGLAAEMTTWAEERNLLVGHNMQMPPVMFDGAPTEGSKADLPVVYAHGMGDSCFNSGMVHIGNYTSQVLGGVYVTCVPTGETRSEDTSNGYLLSMDANVDAFAANIAKDPLLSKGFHAIGFSQGNNVIRGYITRYNDPPVHTFLSVNGVNGGVGAVPRCIPKDGQLGLGGICDLLLEQASKRAYSEWYQEHSFQANYWRDPRPEEKEAYEKFSQLARWNNEGQINQTYKDNYGKTQKFIWVMATEDGMVWPKEGEQWGAADPKDPFNHILPMKETEWYLKDLFGLKTAEEAGKNYFEQFEGDHLQFSMEDLTRWLKTYLAEDTTVQSS